MGQQGNTTHLLSGISGVNTHPQVKLNSLIKLGISRLLG
jgi:hypothetical protein